MYVILFNGFLDERKGGPSGYLAKLKNNLNENNIKFVYKNKNNKSNNFLGSVKSHAKKFLQNIYLNKIIKNIEYDNFYNQLDLKNIKSIHFHSTLDLYTFNKMFPDNKIIKILTSHSPEIPANERINSFNFLNNNNRNKLYKYFLEVDKVAFKLSDYIIFPSKNSMEPYYNSLADFSTLIKGSKIKYLYTGTPKLNFFESKEKVLDRYNIKNSFIVSYVGRHNTIKGYDLIKKAAKILWNDNYNITFLIAGKEEPIKGLEDKRWIEVGWTRDPGSIINASDVFLLPNRQTYFDLILLEVLSLAKPVIASDTGGNKDFFGKTKGVIPFKPDNIEDLVKTIIRVYNLNNSELENLGKENYNLYNRLFTIEKMSDNYKKVIEEIYKENNIEVF